MEIIITRSLPAHLDGIERIENASFEDPWSREMLLEEIESENRLYLTALMGEAVIGYAGMWKILDEAHIMNIAVDPAYRGIGLGRRLLRALEEDARRSGVTALTLEVRVSNAPAIGLYLSEGYEIAGTRKKYYQNGEDAYIMWKEEGHDIH